ncbi:hypothetical protein GCM10028818_53020 [Spirosoma horti]
MRLENEALHKFLQKKGIYFLYHANTVSSSITYFEQGGLLSRGAVEELGLYQSDQSSDELDKAFSVWNDVFIDTTDLHGYFPRQNLYGPVLFEFTVDLVLNIDYEIWITKDNPINWSKTLSDEEKYFVDIEELSQKWDTIQRQRKMVTIRNNKASILFDYLNKIIVDDPRVKINDGDIHLFKEAKDAIKKTVEDKPRLNNMLIVRQCTNCFCRSNYLNQVGSDDLKRLFLPNS